MFSNQFKHGIGGQNWITWHTNRKLKAYKSECDEKQSSEVILLHFGG